MKFNELSPTAQKAAIETFIDDVEFEYDPEYNQATPDEIIEQAYKYEYNKKGEVIFLTS